VLGRKENPNWAATGVEFIKGDITDVTSVEKAVRGVDFVYHLAGLIAYKASERQKMEDINVGGTKNIGEACVKYGVKKLVYMSSVCAIGASETPQALDENSEYTIGKYNLGYFETKRKSEIELKKLIGEKGLDAVFVNPSTVYGKGDVEKGSRSAQVKVAQGRFKFYAPGGVSIADLDSVVAATLKAREVGRTGERYILSGDNITIKQLFEMIAAEAGVEAPKIRLPRSVLMALGHIGDFATSLGLKGGFSLENAISSSLFHWFNHDKAKRELGYNPLPAREAIKHSVQYFLQNK